MKNNENIICEGKCKNECEWKRLFTTHFLYIFLQSFRLLFQEEKTTIKYYGEES